MANARAERLKRRNQLKEGTFESTDDVQLGKKKKFCYSTGIENQKVISPKY